MLCFDRKPNQSTVIDLRQWGLGLLKITPTGKRHQLRFEGERQIPIYRKEVFERIEEAANDDTVIHREDGE